MYLGLFNKRLLKSLSRNFKVATGYDVNCSALMATNAGTHQIINVGNACPGGEVKKSRLRAGRPSWLRKIDDTTSINGGEDRYRGIARRRC